MGLPSGGVGQRVCWNALLSVGCRNVQKSADGQLTNYLEHSEKGTTVLRKLILVLVAVAIAGTMWGIGGQQNASAHSGGHDQGCSGFGAFMTRVAQNIGEPGAGDTVSPRAQAGNWDDRIFRWHRFRCR